MHSIRSLHFPNTCPYKPFVIQLLAAILNKPVYLSMSLSRSVWPLQAVEVPSESDDLEFDLEDYEVSGCRLAGR